MRRLDDEDIPIDDLALRRPSLDEVFLGLTGHTTEAEADVAARSDDNSERSLT